MTTVRTLCVVAGLIVFIAVPGAPGRLPAQARALPAPACESKQVARVARATDGLRIRHANRWKDVKKGAKIYKGDTLQTRKGQRVALAVCGGGTVFLNQESVAVMPSTKETQTKQGELAEKSAKKKTQSIRTRDAVAQSHGSYFDVKVQRNQSVFTVASGSATVRNGHGQVLIGENHQSAVRAEARPPAPKQVDAQRVVTWADPLGETWKILTAKNVLSGPYRVAVDSHGNIFTTDDPTSGRRVVKLSPTGQIIKTWRLQGTVTEPVGIAVDRQDNVYVTDNTENDVQKFTDDGQPLATYDIQQFTPGKTVAPEGIDVDAAGNMYVVAEFLPGVEKLSPTGQLLAIWGSAGPGPLQFDTPQDCAVDGQGNIYVADHFNDRVQKLSPSGQYLTSWSVEKNQSPNDVAVDKSGNVYVAMSTRVEEYEPNGKLLRSWQNDAVSHILTDPGEFDRAFGVTVDAQNNLYVADHYNNRIQKLIRPG
jgi:DNA-binding beta-propeller fold protein YncE